MKLCGLASHGDSDVVLSAAAVIDVNWMDNGLDETLESPVHSDDSNVSLATSETAIVSQLGTVTLVQSEMETETLLPTLAIPLRSTPTASKQFFATTKQRTVSKRSIDSDSQGYYEVKSLLVAA